MSAQAQSRLWVVKIGGSLARSPLLKTWLGVLTGNRRPGMVPGMVIVPGGGPFAEEVRRAQKKWGFAEHLAHRMAIGAMEQFALLLSGLAPDLVPAGSEEAIRAANSQGRVALWMPASMTAGHDDIPQSWEVTSDSLAAWLAGVLDADRLILVKAAAMPDAPVSADELRRRGIVDEAFASFITGRRFDVWCIDSAGHRAMAEALATGAGPGTRVLPGS